MNKQEIEKAIYELGKFATGETYDTEYTDLSIFDLAISALEQQLTNGWIPVSERLPEKGEKYLVTFQGKTVDTCQFINGHFRIYREKMTHLISAWQPLPEPYKEDKDAERN